MEFNLDDDQQLLEKTARSLARSRAATFPRLLPEHLSSGEPDGDRLQAIEACWAELVELGLTALLVPERAGGAGGTLLEAAIVTEALAYELLPVPYAGNAIITATLLAQTATDESHTLLERIINGGRLCVALDGDLRWSSHAGGVVAWDWLPGDDAVIATNAGVQALPTGPGVPCADPLRRLATVAAAPGERREPSPIVIAYARVAAAAQLTGLARRAVDVAADHARNRVQFGSPIGAFQAVQQLLADCLVASEAARSALLGSAWLASADDAAAPAAGATAFAVCAEAAVDASVKAMQVLGGIGATWAADAHQLLRSARLLSAAFGGLPAAYELLADGLLAA